MHEHCELRRNANALKRPESRSERFLMLPYGLGLLGLK